MLSYPRRSFCAAACRDGARRLALGAPSRPRPRSRASSSSPRPTPAAAGTRRPAPCRPCCRRPGSPPACRCRTSPGAGGTIGLAQFVTSKKRKGDAILVAGQTLQGAIITNKSPVSLDQVTPLARIVGEYEIVVVPVEFTDPDDGRPRGQAEGGPGCGVVGRRLGRQHRPYPGRPDHEGGGCRPRQAQLHRALRRRRSPELDPGRPRHGGHQRLRRVRPPGRRRQAQGTRGVLRGAAAGRRHPDPEGAGARRRLLQLARPVRAAGHPRRPTSRRCRPRSPAWSEPGMEGHGRSSGSGPTSTSRRTSSRPSSRRIAS